MTEGADGVTPSLVKSAGRALRLIEVLATLGTASFADLRRELDMPKSSLHALVATLRSLGWVSSDHRGGFTLGFRAHAIGIPGLDDSDMIELVDDLMEAARAEVDQTVHLARLDGTDVVYLASKFSRHALNVRFEIGRRLPAYVTALGKAMLAELPNESVEEHLPRTLKAFTPRTITTRPTLLADLAMTRDRQYAEDDEEGTIGLHCFAVAVRHLDLPPLAVSCSVPIPRLDDLAKRDIPKALLRLRAGVLDRLNPVQRPDGRLTRRA